MSTYFTSIFFDVINNRRRLYWLLQTIGWSGYAFFVLAGAAFWDKADSLKVIYTIIASVLGLLISMAMRQSFLQVWDAPALRRSMQTIFTVMLSTAVWTFWKYYEMLDLYKHKKIENFFGEYVYWYSYSFFILLSWTGLYYGIRFYQEMQAEREKNLRIATSAHQSQLKMLRYQLNPHFLFNTLNAISTLIMENKGSVANDMVSALSKFLRYSLDNDPMQKVNLAKEVKAMRLYLSIEKIRFEERLKLNFELEEEARQALVPSMLLQPLIENSIKYAIAKSETGGTISLVARVFAGNLLLELTDDGEGMELDENALSTSKGVGLNNTRERLQQLYGSNHACTFSRAEPRGVKVNIQIPFEKDED